MKSETKTIKTSQYGTLYVVFHGELIFTDVPSSSFIRVRTPHMDEHVFMAGPWLGERHIPAGAMLHLIGVGTGGKDSIHKHLDQFVIFKNPPGNPDAMPYFEILLPRPKRIHKGDLINFDQSALVIETPGVTFETQDGMPPCSLDLRPIFEYHLSSSEPPFLAVCEGDGDDFPIWPSLVGEPGYYSLHVFAESDQDLGAGHSQMAFRESAKLLGVEADVEPAVSVLAKRQVPRSDINGLLKEEHCLPLRDRVVTMAALGQELRQHQPIQFCVQHAPLHPTKHGVLLWLDAGSCGPIGN
jgi:hypothetical protein